MQIKVDSSDQSGFGSKCKIPLTQTLLAESSGFEFRIFHYPLLPLLESAAPVHVVPDQYRYPYVTHKQQYAVPQV